MKKCDVFPVEFVVRGFMTGARRRRVGAAAHRSARRGLGSFPRFPAGAWAGFLALTGLPAAWVAPGFPHGSCPGGSLLPRVDWRRQFRWAGPNAAPPLPKIAASRQHGHLPLDSLQERGPLLLRQRLPRRHEEEPAAGAERDHAHDKGGGGGGGRRTGLAAPEGLALRGGWPHEGAGRNLCAQACGRGRVVREGTAAGAPPSLPHHARV